MSVRPQVRLVGRRAELATLGALLDDVRSGRSRVLVVRGDPGIGKTALVSHAVSQTPDFRVLQVTGSEFETEFAFAGLHQLCGPLMPLADQLPAPQLAALRVALGLESGNPPDRLLVGLAVLTLLGAASSGQPVVCVVDDAQWIDTGSLEALSFAARRLLVEPVAMLFAARHTGAERELRGHPEMRLAALNPRDSLELLMTGVPGQLDDYVAANLLAEAQGNPLALLELHRALTPSELAGGYGLASATNARALEAAFGRRLSNLPQSTLRLLLIAAADPAGRPEWLRAAAKHVGIPLDAAGAAETEGLVTVEDGIRFRHPLIRSAIYRNAPLADRQQAHAALAAVIAGPAADDYRAWHRAHGAGADDDIVADDLERSAVRARGRGGAAAAAAFLARSAALTSDPRRRASRALDAAEAKLDAGLPRAALPLIATVEAATDDEKLTARAELIRAKAAFAASRGADAPASLLSAAARLAPLDAHLSRETYLQAVTASILVGRCATDATSTPSAMAEAAKMAPRPSQPPRAVDRLLDGLVVRLTEGHHAAAPILRQAISAYLAEIENGTADPRWHDITHRVCLDVFDIASYNFLVQRQVDQLRSEGALSVLPLALQTYSGIEVSTGNFGRAEMLLEESRVITSVTGAPLPGCLWAYLAAYRGERENCLQTVENTIRAAEERGEGFDIDGALYSAAILHLGLSQYPEALAAASAATQHDDIGVQGNVLNELVEAAARCGEEATATAAADELQRQAEVCPTETALGMAARATALAGAGSTADAAYQSAIAHLERSPFVVYLPRAHLVYGEWLRREKRRAEARMHLRTAYESFAQMGAEGFANRALRELKATGEAVLVRGGGGGKLTTQEVQIASLARDGYSNAEIASQLYISPRTVEWHLNHIFGKLKITSRKQLRDKEFSSSKAAGLSSRTKDPSQPPTNR